MRKNLLDRVLENHRDRDAGNGSALGPRERRALVVGLLAAAAVILLGDYSWPLSLGVTGLAALLLLKTGIEHARESA